MLLWSLRAFFLGRTAVAIEMLALRQQLAVFRHSVKRPRLRQRDRIFWVLLSRFWQHWQAHLVIVQPATVIRWHRQGFKIYWRWKSRTRTLGRPRVDAELRELIRRMSRENPSWGAPRIQSELALLGHQVCESTVAKYMVRYPKPPSQTWRTFLMNHMKETVATDFFTVPTATFRVLYVFLVLRHERREVIHFNVTQYPTSSWTAQQLVEAFPYDESPEYLLRDNDGTYGDVFQLRVQNLGIDEIKTVFRLLSQSADAFVAEAELANPQIGGAT